MPSPEAAPTLKWISSSQWLLSNQPEDEIEFGVAANEIVIRR